MKSEQVTEYLAMNGIRCEEAEPPRKPPAGCVALFQAKPRCGYCHYSRPDSQGALICETRGFPGYYRPGTEECATAYSDRLAFQDYDRFKKTCELAGGGEQAWAYKLPALTDQKLREFAQWALTLPVLPGHVRILHHYNVSSGYSCPTIEAIYEKQGQQPGSTEPE